MDSLSFQHRATIRLFTFQFDIGNVALKSFVQLGLSGKNRVIC
jgi:hypothetical protein